MSYSLFGICLQKQVSFLRSSSASSAATNDSRCVHFKRTRRSDVQDTRKERSLGGSSCMLFIHEVVNSFIIYGESMLFSICKWQSPKPIVSLQPNKVIFVAVILSRNVLRKMTVLQDMFEERNKIVCFAEFLKLGVALILRYLQCSPQVFQARRAAWLNSLKNHCRLA